jgi:hypothetical protein
MIVVEGSAVICPQGSGGSADKHRVRNGRLKTGSRFENPH